MIRTVATVGAVVATAASCGGYTQTPPETALEQTTVAVAELIAWETTFGPQAQCRLELVTLRWEAAPQAVLGERCTTSMALSGCFSYEGGTPVITISNDTARSREQIDRIRRHELRHWLLSCSEVDPTGDPEHDGPWWVGLM